MSTNLAELPSSLPVPVDDGGADHIAGLKLPDLALPASGGSTVQLASLRGWVVIYVYPMTGQPGVPLPNGWDEIPGARGCTPQSISFRDRFAKLQTFNTRVFGLSSQSTEYQREAHDRLQLPFELLSDSPFRMKEALRLPTFVVQGIELYKRLTLIIEDATIKKVFYPVFPPDKNVDEVLTWLSSKAK